MTWLVYSFPVLYIVYSVPVMYVSNALISTDDIGTNTN